MTDPLQLLHVRELKLTAALPEAGYFEQLAPVIEHLGLPEKWVQILRDYVDLLENPACRREALRRALFLVWFGWNEPWQLTGMRDLDADLELRVLGKLESELQLPEPDPELRSMLGGYGEGLPFDQHPEFGATFARVRGSAGPDPGLLFQDLASRGAMGAYWLSPNDLPDKALQPASRGQGGVG